MSTRTTYFFLFMSMASAWAPQGLGAVEAPWQVGPCGRGGLCPDQATPLPTPTETPSPNPNAPTPTATVTPTITPTPYPYAFALRVNVGAAAPFTDSLGAVWAADHAYQVGDYGYVGQGSQAYGSVQTVLGSPDQALYRDLRQSSGILRYKADVPAGNYRLILKFADLSSRVPGERLLTLKCQGQTLLAGLDLLAIAGPSAAHDRSFNITAPTGSIDIEISASAGRPLLNAFELRGLQAGPTPTPQPTISFTPNPTPLDFQLLQPLNAVEMP